MIDPFSNPSYLLSPLIAGVISCILLVTVLLKARRSLSTWMFCCFLLSAGLVSFLLFGMRSSPDVDQALPWDRAVMVVSGAAFAFYYHFTLTYANTNTRIKRCILYAAYSFVVVLGVLAPTDLLVQGMRLEDYGYAPIIGPLVFPLGAMVLFLAGVGAHNLSGKYRITSSYEERNRIVYLLIAIIFPVLGILLDVFSNLPPASMWSNLIFSIICTIAIVKYHLLDIRIAVRKGLVYLFISVLVAVPYVSAIILLNQILKTAIEPWWVHAIIILLLAVALRPLYSWAQQLVDRLFYRHRYDYLRALQQFSQEAQSIVNLEELSSIMTELVSGALYTSSVCLLLASRGKHGLVVVSSAGLENPPSGVVLRGSSPLVKWLELHGGILSSEELNIVPQLQSFSLKEKTYLERMGAKLYVPIKTRRGQLSGILVLGQKLSQQSYSGEDKQLLIAVSNQMAIALENAWLYEETRESEEKLRLMYESMTEGITVSDLDGNILQMNEAAVRMCGFDNKEEVIGRSAFEFIAEKDRATAMENLKRALRDGYVRNTEYTLLGRNGSEYPAELSADVLKDTSGNPTGFVAVTQDITERKQVEEREKHLQQQLHLSSRLASIGELAAGVAHEINNPLTGILGFSERLLRRSTDEKARQDLERINNETQRVARVVENLLTFARRKQPKKEYSNINDILQKALEMRIYELEASNIEVVTELASSLPSVMVDFQQIQQVFLNIIINAEQAMIESNHGGKLVIKTEEQEDYIRITFTDDGPGIPSESFNRLFDPFFTTRGEKGGTGLGLSICHGIVTEHGGKIYAQSKLGKGTTFPVELPVTSQTADGSKVAKEQATPTSPKHGSTT